MRIIRSRSSKTCAVNKSQRKSKSEMSLLSGSSWGLVVLAVLPLVAMVMVSLCNYLGTLSLFVAYQRPKYVFNWGQSIEMRSHIAAQYHQDPFLPSTVARRSDMSVAEFRDMWDTKWPLIVTDVVPFWSAFQWSKDFLYKFYSKSNITVTQTKGTLSQSSGQVMSLGEFYKLTFEKTTPTHWSYATDEHFITNHPPLLKDVGPNKYADEDYFQLFPEEVKPRNALLLWGTKHSRSKLHVDPYNWTGTIALLKGVKKWKMWPPDPSNTLKLNQRRSGFPLDCPLLVSNVDSFSTGSSSAGVEEMSHFTLEFEQKAGELLFIPTGWAHQAYNLEESLAISSQFMNRNNYKSVLEEVIQCTGVESRLPHTYLTLTPEEQVKVVMSLLPESVLDSAKRSNEEVRERLMCGENSL